MTDPGLYIQIGTSLVSIGVIYGMTKTQIKNIEKSIERLEVKQDKHNGLIERMVKVEQSCKSAHHRITDHLGDKEKSEDD